MGQADKMFSQPVAHVRGELQPSSYGREIGINGEAHEGIAFNLRRTSGVLLRGLHASGDNTVPHYSELRHDLANSKNVGVALLRAGKCAPF